MYRIRIISFLTVSYYLSVWTSAREIEFSACCCYCCLPFVRRFSSSWLVWKSHRIHTQTHNCMSTDKQQATDTHTRAQTHMCVLYTSSGEIANSWTQHARTAATFDSEIQSLALVVNATQKIFVARFSFRSTKKKHFSHRQWTSFVHAFKSCETYWNFCLNKSLNFSFNFIKRKIKFWNFTQSLKKQKNRIKTRSRKNKQKKFEEQKKLLKLK